MNAKHITPDALRSILSALGVDANAVAQAFVFPAESPVSLVTGYVRGART